MERGHKLWTAQSGQLRQGFFEKQTFLNRYRLFSVLEGAKDTGRASLGVCGEVKSRDVLLTHP